MLGVLSAALFAAGSVTSQAGTATYNFDTDPTANLVINGNNDAPWVQTGGNPATGGFLALTYPQGSQSAAVVFPDIDAGKLVSAFRFEADLRVGNSTGDRAADGFSVSFARGNDRYLADPTNTGGGFAGGGPAEFGTETGIAVSFDTWSGNQLPDGADIEGIIVRVDNVTVNRTGLPTRHGACDDNTSLQTGPRDAAYWTNGGDPRDPASWATLCWQPIVIDLDEAGKLTVQWKGRTILDKFQTTYFPSVGQLVLAGRTGGANEHTHFDNIKLTTILAANPIVGITGGNSCGFTAAIADAGTVSPVQNTITMTLNGTPITPSIRREAPNTYLDVTPATPLAPGSTNQVVVSFTTSEGTAISQTRTYVVPAGTVIPASAATTQFTASSSGFTFRVHQLETGRGPGDGNNIPNMENQLAGGFLNRDGSARANVAELSGAVNGIFTVPIINFEQNAGAAGNFTAALPEAAPRPDEAIPGIPGTTSSTDNIAAEILTYLQLKKGCTVLGFNSDDGFVANLGHSPFGPVLGSFGTGRGASDTLFNIVVEQDGVYPIRIAWSEGGGGANLEFFSVLPDGTKVLVNDPENPNAIKAYAVGRGPGVLQSIAPASGWTGANANGPLVITFRDDLTTLNEGSVVVTLDGQTVTPAKTDSGALTTYTLSPSPRWAFGSTHSGSVVYSFGSGTTVTQNFTFGVRAIHADDIVKPGSFAIEAEHYNFDGGQTQAAVSTMPYSGTEYDGLGAVHDVDYHQTYDEQDAGSQGYRIGDIPNVPMDRQVAAGGDLDTDRGDFEVTENYKIGWANDGPAPGDWYNYTRNIPVGRYEIWGAQSHGDAAGSPDRHRLRVTVVGTGGAETTIGTYSRPSSGGWGNNTLNQLMVGPVPAVVDITSATTTLRAYQREGDFDWFILVPTTNPVPAQQFVIEAEDFNHSGGQTVAAASVMPLTTAPYDALSAVPEIDYHVVGDVQDSLLYRTNESPNVPINGNDGRTQGDRGRWVRSPNYKIGWTDSGEWFNYTRTFPQTNYNVYLGMSHGGGAGDRLAGSLQLVTAGATTTTQTTQELGTFDSLGATGGWGNNRLVPMMANGSLATVSLGGEQTVRFTLGSGGDFDYLVFVPAAGSVTPPTLKIDTVTRNGNNIVISWTGAGTVQGSDTLGATANWQNIAGATTSPATIPIGAGFRFFRIVQ